MSARTKCTARMSTGGYNVGPTTTRSYIIVPYKPFFRVKTERFNPDRSDYIVRCSGRNCDNTFYRKDLIFTTYDSNGDDRHYHICCYKSSTNWQIHHYPSSTKQIENYNKLKLIEQEEIQNVFFPLINPQKNQLFALGSADPYKLKSGKLRKLLRERDIDVYTQIDIYEAPTWNKMKALKKLKEFYAKKEVKFKLRMLVSGCIRGSFNNNVPLVLIELIEHFTKIYFK